MLELHRLRILAANRYWSETEARDAVALFERSGLSLGEFADRSKITADRLTRWRKRLAATAPALVKVEVRGSEPSPSITA